jgi:dolichol-phosphate mannosyltransferase
MQEGNKMKISVVVPVYGCPEALETLHKRLTDTLLRITEDYEIILVNDACPKNSWLGIEKLCQADKKVVGINLSRNFGQVNATNAGIEYSTGDYVVLLDCDLQDPPEAIKQLYHQIELGYDIVFVGRANRKDSRIVKAFSRMFYKVYNHMVEGYYNPDIGNYCMVRRNVVNEYCSLPEHNKSFTTILSWMGYRSTVLMIEGELRFEGKSSYNMRRKVNMAMDLITFQSNKPLLFFVKLGAAIGILAALYIVYQLCIYFIIGDVPSGWMSLIAVVSLLGGIQLVSMGVIGIYIGNIFNETKNRKSYLIQEILNGTGKN